MRNARRDGVGVLRPRRRRHGRRQQEHHQDHRAGDRPVRAGLLRLRLEEVRRHHHLAPAHQPAADPVALPHRGGLLRRLPPVRVRRQDRRPRARRAGGRVPAQCAGRGRDGVGPAAARDAGADDREEGPLLRHRRLRPRPAGRHGRADQHHHADLPLRHLRHPPQGRGDRPDQEGDREVVRQARPGGRETEQRRGRPGARAPARGADAKEAAATAAGRRSSRTRRPISCRRSPP